jgi:hypothetical protein
VAYGSQEDHGGDCVWEYGVYWVDCWGLCEYALNRPDGFGDGVVDADLCVTGRHGAQNAVPDLGHLAPSYLGQRSVSPEHTIMTHNHRMD